LKTAIINLKTIVIPAVLNSYSIVFFLNNRVLGVALLLASFINFFAGLSGFLAVLFAVLIAHWLGFDKASLKSGLYSFNALITGIGLGTFFDPGMVFFVLLALCSLLSLLISISMGGWLGKNGLPYLSIPFVLTFWMVLLPSSLYENLGLTHRNIFWMSQAYAVGGSPLVQIFEQIESWELQHLLDIYLRSLSSIIFQNNILVGIVVALALLLGSRIFFSLSLLGFLSAYVFALFVGSEAASITYYNIGANFMMIAMAIGGFFVIPSRSSYLWSILLVPLSSIVLVFFVKLFGYIQLPVFSLPYAVVTILFIQFLRQRNLNSRMVLTPVQHYSPEINLYAYLNNKERLERFLYLPLQLPFWGEWTLTQGHNGAFTHKKEWQHAFDFMILDQEGQSFRSTGLVCSDYYCYGKPVLAAADGVVTEIQDKVEDNEIDRVNTTQNWGNSVVIRHANGLYTQVSHLKKHSVKVNKGDFVKAGEVIGLCGNSGRSPYPHLHFQVQASPYIGSPTLDYPLAYFLERHQGQSRLRQFTKPAEKQIVSNLTQHAYLYQAFNIQPDKTLRFSYTDKEGKELTESWQAMTDAYNYSYLYCAEKEAYAYYTCDNTMFYFTTFYGNKDSLLYHFFLVAYKILLAEPNIEVQDKLPLSLLKTNVLWRSLNDFFAPFVRFVSISYRSAIQKMDHSLNTSSLDLESEISIRVFGKTQPSIKGFVHINQHRIESFKFISEQRYIYAKNTT